MKNLETLTAEWLAAKADENAANKRRGEIEAQITALLPVSTEGTVNAQVGEYRIGVRYGVTRKVDTEKLQAMWGQLGAKAQDCFKWKADVALPKLRALQEYVPAEYTKLAAVIEAKPSKPSVSIEVHEREAA